MDAAFFLSNCWYTTLYMISATVLTVIAVAVLDFAFARTIYLYSDKSKQAYYYAYIAVFAGLWSLATGVVNVSQGDSTLFRVALVCHYIFGNYAYVCFYIFGTLFVSTKQKNTKLPLFVRSLVTINALGVFLPFLFGKVFFENNTLNPFGYWIFVSSLSFIFIAGLITLAVGMSRNHGEKRTAILFILLANLLAGFMGIVFNLILPFSKDFSYFYISPPFVSLALIIFGLYSLFKFQVFNVRLVLSELIVSMLLLLSLYQLIKAVSVGENVLLQALFSLVIILAGMLLIQAIHKSEERRRKIEELAKELTSANEKLQSLDKLKSEFISLASHQLRSPLTVIKGYASTLTDGVVGELTPKQNEIARHIYTAAQGLASVVEDFLNVTKIEQGGMKYVFDDVDLKVMVKDLISDMTIPAQEKHLELRGEIDDTGSYVIKADSTKIKQVFLNVVDNSIKYTKEGFVAISLHNEGETVVFSVTDSGVGISQETQSKLFKKFARGDSGALNSGGSGLGLYLAQEIVKAHNGEIRIKSEGLDKGATFSVVLKR